jgi:NTP pyrophosphatase (non-canonical NTP hydrolase)
MNINELCKRAHDNAVSKGFYDCPHCNNRSLKGAGNITLVVKEICSECNGTGKAKKDIEELLMLIISECGEALEADRKNYHSNNGYLEVIESIKTDIFNQEFEKYIKDTFEDELADICIRLFDMCGYLNIEPEDWIDPGKTTYSKISLFLYDMCDYMTDIKRCNKHKINQLMGIILSEMFDFCKDFKIDIEKHIELKMKYNETRPYKHGKEY